MPTPIRVMLADDDPLAQQAIEAYLSRSPDIELVATARDGDEAIAVAEQSRPDVAIVDIHMPKRSGLDVTKHLTRAPLNIRVVCFTALGDDRTLLEALDNGASGFLLKSDNPGLILHGIRSAYSGDALLSPPLLAALLRSRGRTQRQPPSFLSERDRELLGHIGNGLSNSEIAERMYLAPSSVKTYVSRLLAKLERPNRAALAALAYEWGLTSNG